MGYYYGSQIIKTIQQERSNIEILTLDFDQVKKYIYEYFSVKNRGDSMYTVKKANVRDYNSVSNLILEVHKIHVKNRPDVYLDVDKVLDEEEFKKALDDHNTNIFVVENNKNKEIQAYAWVKTMNSPCLSIVRKSKCLYIEDICVKSTCRRNGLGKLLFEYIKEFANNEEIESIQLSVWNFNKDAMEFYRSMGMTVRNIKMELEVR